jgi:hypothetical protein
LKIVVCVKQVPDSAARVVAENGRVTWGDAPLVINPWDEYAVETALTLQESQGASVTVLSMGDESAKDALNMPWQWDAKRQSWYPIPLEKGRQPGYSQGPGSRLKEDWRE